jgi:Arc/MetJ-type ribon-helix-helix transcriptional regulator
MIGRLNVAKKSKYRSVSLPSGVAEAIERLIEELGFWPSVGAFAREACIKMIREEWPRLETKEPPIEEDPMRGRRRRR